MSCTAEVWLSRYYCYNVPQTGRYQRALSTKVIWLAVGNCSTTAIEQRLRGYHEEIEAFATEPDTTLLVIEPGHKVGRR